MALKIKPQYDTEDEIPEGMRDLYDEKNGKFVFGAIDGLKTETDVNKLQSSLKKAQDENKALKKTHAEETAKWSKLGEFDDVVAKVDRVGELEALVDEKKVDETKINEIAQQRALKLVAKELAPLKRENEDLKKVNGDLKTENETHTATNTKRDLKEKLRSAAVEKDVGVLPEVMDDVIDLAMPMFEVVDGNPVTREGLQGIAQGLDPKAFLLAQKNANKRAWMFPSSNGTGARGGAGGGAGDKNPWSEKDWNITEQGRYVVAHGKEKAAAAAAAVGSKLGATAPTKKVAAS